MILHYLKVAIRNLFAHKTQTLISLLGLAMAFACMSLAAYWNYYERTYDSFQNNADRIYRIRTKHYSGTGDAMSQTPYPLHHYLKEKYPEVEKACAISRRGESTIFMNGITYPQNVFSQQITSEVLDIFDFDWIEGNKNVMAYQDNQIAISELLAKGLCKDDSPLGATIEFLETKVKYEVVGVYKARPQHSNVKFDIIMPLHPTEWDDWNCFSCHTYVLLNEKVNHELFIQKMHKDTIRQSGLTNVYDIITPLKALRQQHPDSKINVSLKDVNLFTMGALILAFCALSNYLMLFVSRIRARGRDMALRAICGSSVWQTSGLLMTEYMLLLVGASLVGMLFVELVMQKFMELAMIQIEFFSVIASCGFMMLFSVVLSVLLSAVPILYFKRKTLKLQIEATPMRLGNDYFRSIGVGAQLAIGILFIFCTTVMIKQVYMLTNVDNIVRNQIAWIHPYKKDIDVVNAVLKQQPYITQTLVCKPLYPTEIYVTYPVKNWDQKSGNEVEILCSTYQINDKIAQFYSLRMKEGSSTFDLVDNEVFINEALAKHMNLDNPVGKTIEGYRIKGIIYDYQIQSPNTPTYPTIFMPVDSPPDYIAFKYNGDWKTCKNRLEEELKKKEILRYDWADGKEYYQHYLKSEYNLLKLLGIITAISILIAIFGIYALIMQSCDQHQKEIAIRKVYGANIMDILLMFFTEYMMQVVVAAVIAFPIGYVLMKNWLEQYTRQTEITVWIYLGIFLGISLLITLCIGSRVWRAANENPAQVIKKE